MNILSHYSRLHEFIQERIKADIYPEPPSQLHTGITEKMIERLNNYESLSGKKVLDCGCGQGIALELFKAKGAQAIGTTFGEDHAICKQKGFEVYEMDQSFLDFAPETFEVVWCRHALEHSLFPLFTLRGFFEVLKKDGLLYVEVPAPDTSAQHETNRNHYSCFTKNAWMSLFQRSGFTLVDQADMRFKVPIGDDLYHSFLLKKVK